MPYTKSLSGLDFAGVTARSPLKIDWCCFYYFARNSLVALLEALCARIFSFRFVNIGFCFWKIYVYIYIYIYICVCVCKVSNKAFSPVLALALSSSGGLITASCPWTWLDPGFFDAWSVLWKLALGSGRNLPPHPTNLQRNWRWFIGFVITHVLTRDPEVEWVSIVNLSPILGLDFAPI